MLGKMDTERVKKRAQKKKKKNKMRRHYTFFIFEQTYSEFSLDVLQEDLG